MRSFICFLLLCTGLSVRSLLAADGADASPSNPELRAFFEASFERELRDSPMFMTSLGVKDRYGEWDDFSDAASTEAMARAAADLASLRRQFDPATLSAQDQLSYRLFERRKEADIASYQWRLHTYPCNQMFGFQSRIPAFLISYHRVDTPDDAVAYIDRLNGVGLAIGQVIEGLEKRRQLGVLPPLFVFAHVLQDCRNLLVGAPFEQDGVSPLMEDFSRKLAALSLEPDQREALLEAARSALLESVGPAYTALMATLESHRALASDDAGVWKLPRGEEYYAHCLRQMTTTDLSAEQIHAIGLREVSRVHEEMRSIMEHVSYSGDLPSFFNFLREDDRFYYPDTEAGRERYLAEATAIIDRMRGDLDRFFKLQPKAAMEVRRVEAFREKSAGKAFYMRGSPDGSRPGIYYANLYNMRDMPVYQMEALAFHEGIPGHHMQISIAQELEDLPRFRKFGGYTAYSEGWALYCERLPREYGYYADPYSDFGRLAMELWRAARLVVDTGLHHYRWTREEAIRYLEENTPNSPGDCRKAIERYSVMPGQATAYQIGMLRILDIREAAMRALGDRFDIRGFHDVLLENGALPLEILEERVQAWVSLEARGNS
jgi:uncharacterized protein (DUF885 family)